jgi:hypothetical protein
VQDRCIPSMIAFFAVLAIAPVLLAQTQKPSGVAADQATAKVKAQTPDLSGVWIARSFPGTFTKQEPPLTPWAVEKFKANTSRPKAELDPDVKCFPPGPARVYLHHYPFEIINTPGRVMMLFEYDSIVRQVYTDGRGHPGADDLSSPWMGHSIGRWDGDTLVVDTIGMNDTTWLDEVGHPHSDALHLIERLRRVNHDTLQIEYTFDDPKAFTKAWTAQLTFALRPGWDITEHVCADNFLWKPQVEESK